MAATGTPTSSQPPNAPQVETPQALKTWWAGFKKRSKKEQNAGKIGTAQNNTILRIQAPAPEPAPGIFGIPLETSIRYANVAISLLNDQGESFIYGYVPIVVAKCGVFLKEKGNNKQISIVIIALRITSYRRRRHLQTKWIR